MMEGGFFRRLPGKSGKTFVENSYGASAIELRLLINFRRGDCIVFPLSLANVKPQVSWQGKTWLVAFQSFCCQTFFLTMMLKVWVGKFIENVLP